MKYRQIAPPKSSYISHHLPVLSVFSCPKVAISGALHLGCPRLCIFLNFQASRSWRWKLEPRGETVGPTICSIGRPRSKYLAVNRLDIDRYNRYNSLRLFIEMLAGTSVGVLRVTRPPTNLKRPSPICNYTIINYSIPDARFCPTKPQCGVRFGFGTWTHKSPDQCPPCTCPAPGWAPLTAELPRILG